MVSPVAPNEYAELSLRYGASQLKDSAGEDLTKKSKSRSSSAKVAGEDDSSSKPNREDREWRQHLKDAKELLDAGCITKEVRIGLTTMIVYSGM